MAALAPLGVLTGTAHSRLTPPLVRLDLTDESALRAAFAACAPDLVVHSAAERRPDIVDGDPAKVSEVSDVWTFAREVRSPDPNWRLIATEVEG